MTRNIASSLSFFTNKDTFYFNKYATGVILRGKIINHLIRAICISIIKFLGFGMVCKFLGHPLN